MSKNWWCSLSWFCLAAVLAGGCSSPVPPAAPPAAPSPPGQAPSTDDRAAERERMVEQQIARRGVKNERVLAALRKVPRHLFVPDDVRAAAYQDGPLPIGEGQTISQPYIVAFMTEALNPQPGQRVLEVGTGSGYQAAVLAELGAEVYTIELLPTLAAQAKERLERLGYRRVRVRTGDGYKGWPEAAPFDAIMVTCGADHVPPPLFEQLKPGGMMIIPVGPTGGEQWLRVITKGPEGQRQEQDVLPVRFVPLRRAEEVEKR
ncbi:MAG TPA: protein-L-isoaspartate(D-aspartate) O-methyltransferase [Gemmataceae bacterium]|jgi:protein-L-isoaspartate(D-aspartate) O-methyltransferase|nr:protein-L-isoaspartate(D-aspartate) O-methyltransferase [Gemmataceae bacterium]